MNQPMVTHVDPRTHACPTRRGGYHENFSRDVMRQTCAQKNPRINAQITYRVQRNEVRRMAPKQYLELLSALHACDQDMPKRPPPSGYCDASA